MDSEEGFLAQVFYGRQPEAWRRLLQPPQEQRRVAGPFQATQDTVEDLLAERNRAIGVTRPARPFRECPTNCRFVTEAFLRLLKAVVDVDQNLRTVRKEIRNRVGKYNTCLEMMSVDIGKVSRLQRKGIFGSPDEIRVATMGYEKRLLSRRNAARKFQNALSNLEKDRRRAFIKLYRASQKAIDDPPDGEDGPHFILPNEFFETLQNILDARIADRSHAARTRELRERVSELKNSLRTVDPEDDHAISLNNQREEASKAKRESAMEDRHRAQNMSKKERILIRKAWPYVAIEGELFQRAGLPASNVSRGDMHETMDDNVSNEVKAIPDDEDHLKNAFNAAIQLHESKMNRFNRLAGKYSRDLEKHLNDKVDKHLARIEFDNQFYIDRAQAMREVAIAERQVNSSRRRLEDEDYQELEDMDRNYGTLSEDGQVSSMGTFFLQTMGIKQRLDHPYVAKFLENIDHDNLINPTQPPTEPRSANDSEWEARSIEVGDFDTWSRADDHRTAERIQRWRSEMDVLRGQIQSGRVQ